MQATRNFIILTLSRWNKRKTLTLSELLGLCRHFRHRELIILSQIVFSTEDVNAENSSLIRRVSDLFVADQRSGRALKLNIKACRMVPKKG